MNGKKMASVSGGTRWGGGVWINWWDMARFGYLWLRGGKWGDKQMPPAYVKEAATPSAHGPDYGYLWWLNTQKQAVAERAGVELRRARKRVEHDLDRSRARHRVRVALVPRTRAMDGMIQRIVASVVEN